MKPQQYKGNVLILGEPGVGKRYLAHQIHSSQSGKSALLMIDALSADGDEIRRTVSKVGDNSTVCLANLDSLAPHIQNVILSFLIIRKKDRKPRVIATATSLSGVEHHLVQVLQEFQRVALEPLRKRLEEIPSLTKTILKNLSETLGRKEVRVDEGTIRVLQRCSWPENIKGLYNVLSKGMMISSGETLVLPEEFLSAEQQLRTAIENIDAGRDFIVDHSLWLIEKLLIERGLRVSLYNQSRTAMLFGLSEANFRYRMKKFRLPAVRQKS